MTMAEVVYRRDYVWLHSPLDWPDSYYNLYYVLFTLTQHVPLAALTGVSAMETASLAVCRQLFVVENTIPQDTDQ